MPVQDSLLVNFLNGDFVKITLIKILISESTAMLLQESMNRLVEL